jgi:hypothetical protein
VAALVACAAAPLTAGAQARQPAGTPGPPAARKPAAPAPKTPAAHADLTPADRDARLARAALEAGDAGKAIALADGVLAKEPGHPPAAAVKEDACIALRDLPRALDAYDAWYRVVRLEDMAVLARIAGAELAALEQDPLLEIDVLAARAARRGADAAKARARLTDLAWATPQTTKSWPAIVALARLGDRKAADRAVEAYRASSGSGRVTALDGVIAAGGPGAEGVLREAMGVRDAMLQSTAADGAATLKLKGLVPDLQKLAKDGELFAKFSAAVALAHLGATGGEALIDAAAASPAMDARLKAVTARRARGDAGWLEAAKALFSSQDPVVRYQAAALVAPVDRIAANTVLQPGTLDPNPAVRTLVADLITKDPGTPVAELRRLLRDGIPRVRFLAAAAILERPAPPA